MSLHQRLRPILSALAPTKQRKTKMQAIVLMRQVPGSGPTPVLVNWSLAREIFPAGDAQVTVHFTDDRAIDYVNSLADVQAAIRRAGETSDSIARTRKRKVPKKCTSCGNPHQTCPSCGQKAACGCDFTCAYCGYVASGFDELDAADRESKKS